MDDLEDMVGELFQEKILQRLTEVELILLDMLQKT
jgi:hypothetical protein